jgi:hypothetical protein
MANTYEEVMQALRNADAAGDTESAARLAQIANQMQTPATSQVPLSTTSDPFSFVADVARQRAAAGVGTVAGAAVTPPLPGARLMQAAMGFPGIGTQTQKTAEEAAKEAFGVRGLQPADESQRYMKAVTEGVIDPFNLIGPYGGIVSSIFGLTGRGLAGGMAGAGGELGAQTGEQLQAGPIGTLGLSVAGAALGGATAIPAALTGTGLRTIGNFGTSSIRRMTEDASQVEAESQIANIIKSAMEIDPNLAAKVSQVVSSQSLGGVNLPLSALLRNPVIDAELASLASRNPQFKAEYSQLWDKAKTALKSKADNMFGMPLEEAVTRISNFTDPQIEKSVKRRLDAFDQAIAKASQLDAKETGDIGKRAIDLRNQKENEARKSMAPVYDKVFKQVEGQNVPSDEVQRIYDFVKQAKIDDIFTQLPAAERAVLREWAPRSAPTQYGDFGVVAGGPPQFSSVPINQLDSLKKAVNKGLQTVTDRADFNKLLNLKSEVFSTAQKVSPEFAQNWKAADAEFARRVGVPFDLQSIQNMDRTQYNEQVVNKITQNRSALTQFLSAVGPDGTKTAEDALTLRIYNAVVDKNTGLVDSKKLQQWRENKNNSEMLTLLPELRNDLYGREGMLRNIQNLEFRKNSLEKNLDEALKTKILGVEDMTPKALVNKFYSEPRFIDEVLKRNGANSENLKALRTFVLDDIMSSSNPMETLMNKNNMIAYGKLFGPSWQNNIKNLTEATELLRRNPADVTVNMKELPKDFVAEFFPGLNIPKVVSLWRNQIMSEATAFATAASYMQSAGTQRRKDKVMMEAFLEPAKLRETLEIVNKLQKREALGKKFLERMVKDVVSAGWNIPRGVAVGTQEPQ